MSLLFRLAGNSEYNQGKVVSYDEDVEKQFSPFKDHPAVRLARQLRASRSTCYDAPMSLAVQLTDAWEPQLVVPRKPWPEGLAVRWRLKDATDFATAAGQFVKDSGFKAFIEQHHSLYETTTSRMQALVEKKAHVEWFASFFGGHPQAFSLVLGLLNGGGSYGPRSRDGEGNEELFCILGVSATDEQGLPLFKPALVPGVIHEFCHSYANPIILRHRNELDHAGKKLFRIVADQMSEQGYRGTTPMLCESLVRASVIRYLRAYDGPKKAEREVAEQKRLGFLWIQGLSDVLGQYETQRDQYPTLESFAPRLVAFFEDYSRTNTCLKELKTLDEHRPRVVSMTPANGARNVDPQLQVIRVVFDRPMMPDGWAICYSNSPSVSGKCYFDTQRTTWTAPVKLKPNWKYRFSLNAADAQGFQSEEGVPLKPMLIQFETRTTSASEGH